MKVIYTGRHVEVSDALRAVCEERLEKMATYLDDIIDVHVIFSVEKHRHQAEITLKTRTVECLATTETDDMYASLTQTLDKIEKQAHKHADKKHSANKKLIVPDGEAETEVETVEAES